jgi:hypothetical protein
VVLASANLFVFLLYFKLAFGKFFPNENNWNVKLFGLPFEQCTNIAFNDAFAVYILFEFRGSYFLKVFDVMLSRILIEERRLGLVSKGKIPNGSDIGLVDIGWLHFLINFCIQNDKL